MINFFIKIFYAYDAMQLNPENADRTLIIVTKEATSPYSDVVNTLVSVGNNKKGTAALITFAIK